jgi:hypothetical protein
MYDARKESVPGPGGWYRITNQANDKVLEVDLDHVTDNGKYLRQCYTRGDWGEHLQQWQMQRVGEDEPWVILRNRANNKVLELDALHPHRNGFYVQQWDYLGPHAHNQHWELRRVEFRCYKLVNRSNGRVLEVDAENLDRDGAYVQQWEDLGGHFNQYWSFVRVEAFSRIEA